MHSQPSACKPLLLPAARQMSSVRVRPLTYNPEPTECGPAEAARHLAFAINLEGNTGPGAKGSPCAGPCGAVVQVEGSGAQAPSITQKEPEAGPTPWR